MNKKTVVRMIPITILNFIFSLFQAVGYMLSHNSDKVKSADLLWKPKSIVILVFAAILLTAILDVIFICLSKLLNKYRKPKETKEFNSKFFRFPIVWAVIFLLHLPLYLAFFPGICAYDAYVQLEQCISGNYIDHHPFLHTLILKFFWDFGEKVSNVTLGIALFVLFQMLVLTAAFSFCICYLKKKGLSKGKTIGLFIFFIIFPYNVFIELSVAKAALFTAPLIVFLTVFMASFMEERDEFSFKLQDLLMILLIIPIVAFRTNARYALLATLGVMVLALIFSKEKRKLIARLSCVLLAGITVSLLFLTALTKAFNVTQGDRREMLSVPIQQLARVAYEYGPELTEENMYHINGFILDEAYKNYDPVISDPVKRHVNTYHALHEAKGFIKTYVELFTKYPAAYVDAFLLQNAGYLYLFDRTCLRIYSDDFGYGFVQTKWPDRIYEYGIEKKPVFSGLFNVTETMLSDNTLQKLPVFGFIFRPGYVLWAYIYLIALCLYTKKARLSIPMLVPLFYIGTLLLGPTVQMRYIYPVWVSLAVFIVSFKEYKK